MSLGSAKAKSVSETSEKPFGKSDWVMMMPLKSFNDGSGVGVAVGVDVAVGVAVGVGVAVAVGVDVAVAVGVMDGVAVGVNVIVTVGVSVAKKAGAPPLQLLRKNIADANAPAMNI